MNVAARMFCNLFCFLRCKMFIILQRRTVYFCTSYIAKINFEIIFNALDRYNIIRVVQQL